MPKNKTIEFDFSILPEYSGPTETVESPKENKIENQLIIEQDKTTQEVTSTDVKPVERALNILNNVNGSSQVQPNNSNGSSNLAQKPDPRTSCSPKETDSLFFKYGMFSLAALSFLMMIK